MELALSLGDAASPFTFLHKTPKIANKDLGFCMALGNNFSEKRSDEKKDSRNGEDFNRTPSAEPPVQLDLLPSVPVPRAHTSSQFRFPWLADNMVVSEPGSSEGAGKGLDVNRLPMIGTTEETEDGAALSSPNSTCEVQPHQPTAPTTQPHQPQPHQPQPPLLTATIVDQQLWAKMLKSVAL